MFAYISRTKLGMKIETVDSKNRCTKPLIFDRRLRSRALDGSATLNLLWSMNFGKGSKSGFSGGSAHPRVR